MEMVKVLFLISAWIVAVFFSFDIDSEDDKPSTLVLAIWSFLIVWTSSIWIFVFGG